MGVGIEREVSEYVSDHSPLTWDSLPRPAVGMLRAGGELVSPTL